MANEEGQRNRKCRIPIRAENILLISMIAAVVAGVVLGAGLKAGNRKFSDREVMYIGFAGDIFLRLLKLLILPLIVSSLVNSLARLNAATAGKLGYITALYFLITTVVAAIEGIVLVLVIRPGSYATERSSATVHPCKAMPVDTILDLLRNLFPSNLVETTFRSSKTCIITKMKEVNYTNETGSWIIREPIEVLNVHLSDGMNILGLVMFSVAFGIIISLMREDGLPLARFFTALEGATMRLVTVVIWYGPIGIIFLIAKQIVEMDDPGSELRALGMYICTVVVGLVIHGFVILPIVYLVMVRQNPIKHTIGAFQALITALGTDSSSATLPVTIKCMEEKNHCDSRVARFVLPLGATVNMNGSALYEAVASIYIAQVIGRELSIGQVILISLTSTLAAVGAAGIPQAGLVTLLMVLTAVDLPPEYSALIIPVDWFLDRLRTVINVFGDTVGAATVNKLCKEQLASIGKDLEEPKYLMRNGDINTGYEEEQTKF